MRRLSEMFTSSTTPLPSKDGPQAERMTLEEYAETARPLTPPSSKTVPDPTDTNGGRLSIRTQPVVAADEVALAGRSTSSLVESDVAFASPNTSKTSAETDAERRAEANRVEVKADMARLLRDQEERRHTVGSNLRRIGYDGAYDKDMKRHGFGRYVYPDGSIYVLRCSRLAYLPLTVESRLATGCADRRRAGAS